MQQMMLFGPEHCGHCQCVKRYKSEDQLAGSSTNLMDVPHREWQSSLDAS